MSTLFEETQNYLDITWEMSEGEKQKLQGMIERGKIAIEGRLGTCDFVSDTQEKTLLLNHVMYERAGALSDFWKNYKQEILSLQIRKRVKRYEAEQENSDVQ